MGSVNHEVVSDLLRTKQQANGEFARLDPDTLRRMVRNRYRAAWEAQLEQQGEPEWGTEDPIESYSRGLLMALTYLEQAIPQITPVAVEEKVEIKIPGVPLIRGYVDVIEPDKIRERKTTRAKETRPKAKWRLQGRIYQFILGLPVEWDVLTRQVEPKLYTAEEYPDLRLESSDREMTRQMVSDLWWRMNDLYQRRGDAFVWPWDGYHDPWLCNYCPIGPRYGSTCGAWS
jgi:hypothetical protein